MTANWYRVRSWSGTMPIVALDVTTASARTAAQDAADRASEYGTWDDVTVKPGGDRPMSGRELELWATRILERTP